MLDELKLGWDDYYDMVRPQGRLSAELLSALDAVSAALAAVQEHNWLGPEGLATSDWNLVRARAKAALSEFVAYLSSLDPAAIVRTPGENCGDGTFLGTNVHVADRE